MIELEVNGKKVEVPQGSLVIQAARKVDTYIPHFCYHKKLSIAANCRMCLVEIEKMPKVVPACATQVSSGMIVHTHSERAIKAQQSVMEFLLINHPLDCPICDQGGECQLQDLAVGYGKSSSRYQEEKRVVFRKNVGPLISMEEMSRCIHCTRCVRFGQEIAGAMELGILGRGEHSEITAFVGKTINSELSGNMIDLCPVGALTSKPFRYTARAWEMSHHKSVSPHDSIGSNLVMQVKNNRIMRVLPFENESVNECWISDKDRFSYEALNSEERLKNPMIKQGKLWFETNWKNALEYVTTGLNRMVIDHTANALAILASPNSTIEELFLIKQFANELKTPNIDFRLRQIDFSRSISGIPWLGMPISGLSNVSAAFVIGSLLRYDHPLFAVRLRQAEKNGAELYFLNAIRDNSLIPGAKCIVAAPSNWTNELASIAASIAYILKISRPLEIFSVIASPVHKQVAQSLINSKNSTIFLGNEVVQHPEFSSIHLIAQWIAHHTNSTLGFLTEAANTVGAHAVKALPGENGLNAREIFAQPKRAYMLMNIEPEFDTSDPPQALSALSQADMVIVMTPFRYGLDYANVLLPISPFTETSGTFVNAEGIAQSFKNAVRPLCETRPGWKVICTLGSKLGLKNLSYESVEKVRLAALGRDSLISRLSNSISGTLGNIFLKKPIKIGFERLSNVPIYHSDSLVRRAVSLHLTNVAKKANTVGLPTVLFEQLGLNDGDLVCVYQGDRMVKLPAIHEENLAETVIRLSAATHISTLLSGSFSGELTVSREF
ncbi:MAG: NADH-quinone oxidoreductase subunit NuoG [Burkholderia sp.]|nr:NADH-quinone oxidoreductase subunit NuoG [Burkholderia sp.]